MAKKKTVETSTLTEKEPLQTASTPKEAGPTPEKISLDDIAHGYIVGMKADGSIFFQPLGKNLGVIELLGLREYANGQVTRLCQMRQPSLELEQEAATYMLTREIRESLRVILQMLTNQKKVFP